MSNVQEADVQPEEVVEAVPTEPEAPAEVAPESEEPEAPEQQADDATAWDGFIEEEAAPQDTAARTADPSVDDKPWDADIKAGAAEFATEVAINVIQGQQTLSATLQTYPEPIQKFAATAFSKLPYTQRNSQSAQMVADMAIGKAVREGRYQPGKPLVKTPPSRQPNTQETVLDSDTQKTVDAQAQRLVEASGGKMSMADARKQVNQFGGRY